MSGSFVFSAWAILPCLSPPPFGNWTFGIAYLLSISFCHIIFEIGSHINEIGLELAVYQRLALNSWSYSLYLGYGYVPPHTCEFLWGGIVNMRALSTKHVTLTEHALPLINPGKIMWTESKRRIPHPGIAVTSNSNSAGTVGSLSSTSLPSVLTHFPRCPVSCQPVVNFILSSYIICPKYLLDKIYNKFLLLFSSKLEPGYFIDLFQVLRFTGLY